MTSISQCGIRGSGARTPASPKGGQAEETGLVVRTVLLSRHHSDCGATTKRVDEVEEEEDEQPEAGEVLYSTAEGILYLGGGGYYIV